MNEDNSGTQAELELDHHIEWSKAEKLQAEYSALGFYLTEHPVSLYLNILKKNSVMFSPEINQYTATESRDIWIAGVVKECKIRSGKGEKCW